MTKTFTIALPVRNGGHYLRLCVESILAQTCGDFELAVLDNASTDGTTDYLAGLRDPRVRLYPAERPLSIEENWARLKTIPKAEFLTTIGHDDLLDPDFLETIAALIREQPAANLYMTHFRLIGAKGEFLRHCRPMPARETAAEFLAVRLCFLRDSFGTGHVLRSAVYDAVGGIPPFPKLLYADDALFMRAIGPGYRATALAECFSYRWHAASASTGCAMAELFGGLEQYGHVLAPLCDGDAAVAEVTRRYFPTYAFQIGQHWKQEALLNAHRARARIDPGLEPRVAALVTRFGEAPSLPESTEIKLLKFAHRSPASRMLYQGLLLGRTSRRWLVDRLARRVGWRTESLP